MNWYTDKARKYAIGVPFKNGYTSVKKVLNGHNDAVRIAPNHMKNFQHKVFVVRHPLDRFLSLWRNKCRDYGSGCAVEGLSMEALFQRIVDGPADEHWTPQTDLLGKYRKEAQLIRLEDLPAWWWQHMQAEFPRLNPSDNYNEISDELCERVLIHYAADVELYNAATKLG